MTTTFTPGPWKVAGSCHVLESADGLYYHVAHVTVDDDYAPNPFIADVCNRGRYCSKEGAHYPGPEQAANAHLIASAPSLLAALIQCEEVLNANFACARTIDGRRAIQAINNARVAIAKAEGAQYAQT